jgi:hypothetical protein
MLGATHQMMAPEGHQKPAPYIDTKSLIDGLPDQAEGKPDLEKPVSVKPMSVPGWPRRYSEPEAPRIASQ